MGASRIAYLDLVKLFTIYLVILGHVIAMMVNGYSVGGRLYAFIYSFHMPLFMVLSGYFVSSRSLGLPFTDLLKSKSRQLLLPAVSCTCICCIYLYFFRDNVCYRDEIIGNSWFLKTLFVYYMIFYILKRIQINDWVLFCSSCVLLFLIPHASSLQVNLLFPYFWGGYMLKKYRGLEKTSSWMFALLFVILFAGGYYLQRYYCIPNYIPINIETILSKWHLILLRYFVAFTGSMSVICLISTICKNTWKKDITNKIARYGRMTLGVYVLQTILVANIFPDTLAWYVDNEFILDVVVAPCLSIVFLVICLWLIYVLSKKRMFDLLLFGGQYYIKK